MKRIAPRKQYESDGGYPSVADVDLSRRGFLAVAATGAAAGAVMLLPHAAEAGRKAGLKKVVLYFTYQLRGCKHYARHRIEKVVVQSYDGRLIAFLAATKERPGVTRAVLAVLKKYTCKDALDATRRSKMARAVGRALVARYRKRKRRKASRPGVSIIVGRRRHPQVDGGRAMPSAPVQPLIRPS